MIIVVDAERSVVAQNAIRRGRTGSCTQRIQIVPTPRRHPISQTRCTLRYRRTQRQTTYVHFLFPPLSYSLKPIHRNRSFPFSSSRHPPSHNHNQHTDQHLRLSISPLTTPRAPTHTQRSKNTPAGRWTGWLGMSGGYSSCSVQAPSPSARGTLCSA